MASVIWLFILVPILDMVLLTKVSAWLGFWNTIWLIVATGFVGGSLARHEWRRTWAQVQQSLATGQMPAGGVINGLLVLVGGVLLITPGVLTDAIGLLLVIPMTRAVIARVAGPRIKARFFSGMGIPTPFGATEGEPTEPSPRKKRKRRAKRAAKKPKSSGFVADAFTVARRRNAERALQFAQAGGDTVIDAEYEVLD